MQIFVMRKRILLLMQIDESWMVLSKVKQKDRTHMLICLLSAKNYGILRSLCNASKPALIGFDICVMMLSNCPNFAKTKSEQQWTSPNTSPARRSQQETLSLWLVQWVLWHQQSMAKFLRILYPEGNLKRSLLFRNMLSTIEKLEIFVESHREYVSVWDTMQ
jgi:hypothetical protein